MSADATFLTQTQKGVYITIWAKPKGSKSLVLGVKDGALLVKLCAPPVEGKANSELIKLMAKTLGVSKSEVELVSGQSGRNKRIFVSSISKEEILQALGL
jgi:uncharacterized protein (TIGR00251 family)